MPGLLVAGELVPKLEIGISIGSNLDDQVRGSLESLRLDQVALPFQDDEESGLRRPLLVETHGVAGATDDRAAPLVENDAQEREQEEEQILMAISGQRLDEPAVQIRPVAVLISQA